MSNESPEYNGPEDIEAYTKWLYEKFPHAKKFGIANIVYVENQPCVIIGYGLTDKGEEIVHVTPKHCFEASLEEAREFSFPLFCDRLSLMERK